MMYVSWVRSVHSHVGFAEVSISLEKCISLNVYTEFLLLSWTYLHQMDHRVFRLCWDTEWRSDLQSKVSFRDSEIWQCIDYGDLSLCPSPAAIINKIHGERYAFCCYWSYYKSILIILLSALLTRTAWSQTSYFWAGPRQINSYRGKYFNLFWCGF